MIDPVMDALTTSMRPALSAIKAMISSQALPNVALTRTTDGGSGVMRDVLACLAHDLGQRHDRQTGDEHDHDGRHLHVGGDEGQRYRVQKTVEQFLHVRFLIGVDEWS